MTQFSKIGTKTWVQNPKNKSLNNYKRKLDYDSLLGVLSRPSDKLVANTKSREDDYRKFVKNVFKNRELMIISEKEFNRLLIQEFGSSSTYYRRRMIFLGLVKSKNKLITPSVL